MTYGEKIKNASLLDKNNFQLKLEEEDYVFVSNGDISDLYTHAHSEVIAHELVYHLTKPQTAAYTHTEILDSDGKVRKYEINRIGDHNLNINGIIFLGIDDNPRVHVAFAGTVVSNKSSILRNFEMGGIAFDTFKNNEEYILEQILNISRIRSNALNSKLNLSISGHSAGGCMAQYAMTSILKNINDKKGFETIVDSLSIHLVNSAGVPVSIMEQCEELAGRLSDQIALSQSSIYHEDDIVQRCGNKVVLPNVPTNMLFVRRNKNPETEGVLDQIARMMNFVNKLRNMLKAHKVKHFNLPYNEVNDFYEIINSSSETKTEIIKSILKANSKFANFLMGTARYINWAFSNRGNNNYKSFHHYTEEEDSEKGWFNIHKKTNWTLVTTRKEMIWSTNAYYALRDQHKSSLQAIRLKT